MTDDEVQYTVIEDALTKTHRMRYRVIARAGDNAGIAYAKTDADIPAAREKALARLLYERDYGTIGGAAAPTPTRGEKK